MNRRVSSPFKNCWVPPAKPKKSEDFKDGMTQVLKYLKGKGIIKEYTVKEDAFYIQHDDAEIVEVVKID